MSLSEPINLRLYDGLHHPTFLAMWKLGEDYNEAGVVSLYSFIPWMVLGLSVSPWFLLGIIPAWAMCMWTWRQTWELIDKRYAWAHEYNDRVFLEHMVEIDKAHKRLRRQIEGQRPEEWTDR